VLFERQIGTLPGGNAASPPSRRRLACQRHAVIDTDTPSLPLQTWGDRRCIIGASASYYPARRVVKVALLEKGRIGAGPWSRNWGGPILDPAPYAPARLNQSARGKVADF